MLCNALQCSTPCKQEDLARSQEARDEATEQLEEATRQLHHLQHQLSASEAQGIIRERTHLQEETAQLRCKSSSDTGLQCFMSLSFVLLRGL